MSVLPKLIPAIAVALSVSAPLHADVSINIGLPAPVVALPAPPPMVWLPGPAIYVAYGSPQPIFFINGQYWLHSQGAWYVGPGYAGPWGHANARHLPPGLHKFREADWRGYQRDAEKHRHGNKTFQAKGGQPDHATGHGKGGNEGKGHGRGHGKDK